MLRITLLALAITAGAAVASPSTPLTAEQQMQIRDTLTEQGYEVRKIEMEDGEIEVYALKDGAKIELYLDADLNIIRTEIDD